MVVPLGWSRVRSLGWPFRLLAFLSLLILVGLPPAGVIWVLWPALRDGLWILLYLELLGLLWIWGKRIWGYEAPYKTYGVSFTVPFYQDLTLACGWALLGLLGVMALQGLLGWLTWRPIPLTQVGGPLMAGLGLGLAVAWVEELVFRGWLLDELATDYGPGGALWGSALIFAAAHFIKPWSEILATWPQFPGLVLLGLILTQASRSTRGRLGTAMGLHAGWVWGITLINSLDWVAYTGSVPAWITGVRGNPLAGLVGLGFLLVNSLAIRIYAQLQLTYKNGQD